MNSEPAKEGERRLKNPPPYGAIALWGCSLLVWFGIFQFPWPARLELAYGSFLLWAVSAGLIWGGRKVPFLAVAFFLLGSFLLQKPDQTDTEQFHWLSLSHGLCILLVFVSSLCSSIWMTARKTAQTAQKRQDHLEQALLQVARMSSLGRMTVSICHEMKNQIAVTIGYLDQLKDEKDFSAAHHRKIDRSLQATDKMLKILTQLRTLARDTLNEPLQAVGVNPVLLDSIDFLDRHILFHGIVMDLVLENDLPTVAGDPVQLQTIFIHLLNHSLENFKGQKAAGGQQKRIRIATEVHEGLVRIEYSDNGTRQESIGPDRFFDLFLHLGSQKLMHGLDMAVVQSLAQRQGASIIMEQDVRLGLKAILQFKIMTQVQTDAEDEILLAAGGYS